MISITLTVTICPNKVREVLKTSPSVRPSRPTFVRAALLTPDPWRPCLKMVIFTIFRHGRQGSPMVAKGFQGPRGTPGMGEMS